MKTITRGGRTTTVPVGSLMSMFDPIYFGIDEYGHPVWLPLIYKNLLTGGEPGSGKSTLLTAIAAHVALCTDARLVLLDAKLVELGLWRDVADEFVGPDITAAITLLKRLQRVLDNRYAMLLSQQRRKIDRFDNLSVIVVMIDELAAYTTTYGSKAEQELFAALLRDLVARGRACGIVVIAATQRPSGADNPPIIPASLRDIFAYRAAFRCTTDDSSDLILGRGWASQTYTAAKILPANPGVGLLLAEGGTPYLFKAPYMTDDQIQALVDYAAWTRGVNTNAIHNRADHNTVDNTVDKADHKADEPGTGLEAAA
ncbi:MAG: FtsK/SpoIIIE domain-containing protein [Micromonosporaceae bacterium]